MSKEPKKLGVIALTALIISSSIGAGIFAIAKGWEESSDGLHHHGCKGDVT